MPTIDADSSTLTWIDPTGVEWPLNDRDPAVGWFTRPGPAGWGGVQYEFVADQLPRGGASVRFIRALPGRITWPLHVHGEDYYGDISHARYLDRRDTIKRAITMTAHRNMAGQLKVTRPDGNARVIDCFYEAGFGGEAGEDHTSSNPTLTLYAPDGYWRAADPIITTRAFAAGQSFFSPFPFVSPGNVLGDTVITNPGDVTAWPVWTITGPAEVVTAVNNTTGQKFTVTTSLGTGEMVIITTDRPTVRGPLGQNLIGALNLPDAYLWPLLPDDNSVNFSVAGAGAGTSIELKFYPRFEGA